MLGRRRRQQRWFDQGRVDEARRQRDDLLRQVGLLPKEREAYLAGRRSAR